MDSKRKENRIAASLNLKGANNRVKRDELIAIIRERLDRNIAVQIKHMLMTMYITVVGNANGRSGNIGVGSHPYLT